MQFYHTYLSLDERISAMISLQISVHERRQKTEEKDRKQRHSEYLLSSSGVWHTITNFYQQIWRPDQPMNLIV